jgi:cell wall-associated NlpC family hydrolase
MGGNVCPRADDRQFVSLRPLLTGSFIFLALIATPAASARSWADSSIATVIEAGILPGETAATYGPARALDHGTLAMLVWGAVPDAIDRVAIPTTDAPVTIGELDATFVAALGLAPTAKAARTQLARLRYGPRGDAGTEVVARLLGLRYNHPAGSDRLERSDTEIATRADAAFTTARVLRGVSPDYARSVVAKFAGLPATTGERHAALARAVRLIGMPYVWGGTSDKAIGQAHGGYDCSGFVWRALILDPAAPKRTLKRVGGRTTFEMARTTSKSRRLTRARTRPGDILLFGSSGRSSKVAEIGHSGIDLGNGLMLHSSSQGVTIKEWDAGWHATSFAFAKSVLP